MWPVITTTRMTASEAWKSRQVRRNALSAPKKSIYTDNVNILGMVIGVVRKF